MPSRSPTRKHTCWTPGPRRSRNRPIGVSGPVGSRSSIFAGGRLRLLIGGKESCGHALLLDAFVINALLEPNQGPKRRAIHQTLGCNADVVQCDGSKAHAHPSESAWRCVFAEHLAQHATNFPNRGLSSDGFKHDWEDVLLRSSDALEVGQRTVGSFTVPLLSDVV